MPLELDCPGDSTCSNQGICDDSVGACICDNGFEGNTCQSSYSPSNTNEKRPSKGQQPLNEQVLRVMQSLGIDPTRTTEVIKISSRTLEW